MVRKMLIPTALEERRGWERYVDPATGCEYLYHPATRESKWLGGAVDLVRRDLSTRQKQQQQQLPEDEDDDEEDEYEDDGQHWGTLETICCEQPAALVEALLRCPCYALAAIFVAFVAVFVFFVRGCDVETGASLARQSFRYFRESVLFFVSALSLLIPCSSLFIYRSIDEQTIRPLPTLLGAVDPRRFWAFHLGRASLVVRHDRTETLDYPWTGSILHPPAPYEEGLRATSTTTEV